MCQRGHDDPRSLLEVYDYPEPASRDRVVAVKPLTTRNRIALAVLWARHGFDDHRKLIEQVSPLTVDEVAVCAVIEDDFPSVRVRRSRNGLVAHGAVASGAPPSARVKRSARSPAGRAWR